MKIISTNIGEAKTFDWHGEKVTTGIFKHPVQEPLFLGAEDVEKDHVVDRRHHGGVDKACYMYAADHYYYYWKDKFPNTELSWGMFGENLTVEGLNEAEINIGDVFKIGETVVQATQPRQPCFKLDIRFNTHGLVRQFVDSGYSGVYLRVLEKGKVSTGDLVELIEPQNSISIQKVFQLLYTSEFEKEAIETAINNPFIAASCKKDLLKRWGDML